MRSLGHKIGKMVCVKVAEVRGVGGSVMGCGCVCVWGGHKLFVTCLGGGEGGKTYMLRLGGGEVIKILVTQMKLHLTPT